MINQPSIDVLFKQLAVSFPTRSERGIVNIIVKDDTTKSFVNKTYKNLVEFSTDAMGFTSENQSIISDCFKANPYLVNVIRIDVSGKIADGLKIAEQYNTGWTSFVGTKEEYEVLVSWIKDQTKKKKTFMGISFGTDSPNDTNIVDLSNVTIDFKDSRGHKETPELVIPELLSIFASANVDHGATYKEVTGILRVGTTDIDYELSKGKLVLFNDEGVVKINLAINSLTTLTSDRTEDFKFVETIEINNLIKDDVTKMFKAWVGVYKNTYNKQVILLNAINSYLKLLADQEILDPLYNNRVEIDVDTQKKEWMKVKPEAVDWDDTKVKNMTLGRKVFLRGFIKEVQSMTDLALPFTME